MSYTWIGSERPFLDTPMITEQQGIHIGWYGGHTEAGANKNEDGLFIMQSEDGSVKLAVLLDAHQTATSAALIVQTLQQDEAKLQAILEHPDVFDVFEKYTVDLFSSVAFRQACQQVTGETSCLIVLQKESYLWWFSVGDCMAYLLHPNLAHWGQYGLNQRQFYEWIGQVNTFDLEVPCYTIGKRQLRAGHNIIVLMTDGVIDTPDQYFQRPEHLYQALVNDDKLKPNIQSILDHIHTQRGKDSATIISWEYSNSQAPQMPSDMP
ncbi:protein phosphatase 2C domain-containing protein [Paenibacillus sp. PK4536]|uniref:protein phosphatase 2C domain-containing protein n=1 Tax=Paenibacillus sp. PK4536 TaxID=3024576 RepID=UPI002358E610|nr:protein phosphatase 2C domain-containing protein [Paenibacillus sp. PK4536]WIM37343.1 protein phosphatase 2C domain-containing protein [Paenibacillus sp. PK4536]